MNKHLKTSFLILAGALAASSLARAELLYFQANAFDWDGPKLFDYARIGVALDGDAVWDGTGNKTYLDIQTTSQSGVSAMPYVASDDERYTATGWANILNEYMAEDYSFYLETYASATVAGKADTLLWTYNETSAKTYAELLKDNHIYTSGSTNPQDVTAWVVPEPTSGMLVLFGTALLALRRRRKILRFCLLTLFTFHFSLLTCRAAATDTLISFSTKGPDTYLDGTTVKDGECYALVWTKTGAAFEGLAADGTAVGANSQVVVFAPVAKGGRCPPVLFELDTELAKSYAGGTYGIYLLDTRLANGQVGGVNAKGVPAAVNGYGSVDAVSSPRQGGESSTSTSSVAVTVKSAVPANAPQPLITAIRVVGDNVFLTVKNTLPCLQYAAQEVKVAGESLTAESSASQSFQTAAQGATTPDAEITVIAPKKGASGLYSVGRK